MPPSFHGDTHDLYIYYISLSISLGVSLVKWIYLCINLLLINS